MSFAEEARVFYVKVLMVSGVDFSDRLDYTEDLAQEFAEASRQIVIIDHHTAPGIPEAEFIIQNKFLRHDALALLQFQIIHLESGRIIATANANWNNDPQAEIKQAAQTLAATTLRNL